ncbi:hypothetical protein HHI36_009070 [Cryptolaemus montrouzieri]|uniref:RRM domain-containing protein n=1 Tax=Cryptolaemus montrouzieri TaxID=559131 RepID=A0ABD2MUC6_9CUCU
MARFGNKKKISRKSKKTLHNRAKGRQNAKRKPILPKRGVNQTSYESGFFDFLKVFWKSNRNMDIYKLTKQVANVWNDLLPQPKINRKRVFKDYQKEYKTLQQEYEREKNAQKKLKEEQEIKKAQMKIEERRSKRINQMKKEDTESEIENGSKSTLGEDSERSRSDIEDISSKRGAKKRYSKKDKRSDKDTLSESDSERSRSHIEDSYSENDKTSDQDNLSESDSERNEKRRRIMRKTKRKGRKYRDYNSYIRAKKRTIESASSEKDKNHDDNVSENNEKSASNQNKQQAQMPKEEKDGIFFPVKEETSFDRIVEADLDNQTELLNKLRICRPYSEALQEIRNTDEDDSFKSPLSEPKFPLFPQKPNLTSSKILHPTNILHVKNLVQGVRQPDLQELFEVFLNDIVLIRVLEGKFKGEAIVEFKSIDGAMQFWRQMNGFEYRNLPLVLEFVTKEDFSD